MAKPLSMDLRERIVADCDAGERVAVVAEKYRVSRKTVYNLLGLRRETGSVAPRSGKPGRKPKLDEQRETIEETVRQNSDLTLEEMISKLSLCVSRTTLWNTLRRWRITLKKSHPCRRATAS